MKTCILIAGRAGTGKDTSSLIMDSYFIRDRRFKSTISSFAGELKEVAVKMGWDGKKDDRGRKLLQDLGKVGREYDINIWAKKLIEYVLFDYDLIIIPDWRFPNEYQYVWNYFDRVYRIRLEAPSRESLKGTDRYNDVSEISLPSGYITDKEAVRVNHSWYEFVVPNESSQARLVEKLNKICSIILEDLK